MTKKWLRQRDAPVHVEAYCPVDIETGKIMVGLTFIGRPDGEVIGEFWYEGTEIHARLFDTTTREE